MDESQRNRGTLVRGEHEVSDMDRIEVMSQYGIGDLVKGKVIGVSNCTINRWRHQHGIETIRDFDTAYITHKQIYNEDIDPDKITHYMDFYRLSTTSIARGHHSRSNYRLEDGSIILLGLLYSRVTDKRYYAIYSDNKETANRSLWLIEKALLNHEEIKYLQMDRYLKTVIKGCEDKGIIPICKGKNSSHPYNSHAERQFGNISKAYYSILEKFSGLTFEEAKMLFEAILKVYFEYDDSLLIQYDRQLRSKSIAVTVPDTNNRQS